MKSDRTPVEVWLDDLILKRTPALELFQACVKIAQVRLSRATTANGQPFPSGDTPEILARNFILHLLKEENVSIRSLAGLDKEYGRFCSKGIGTATEGVWDKISGALTSLARAGKIRKLWESTDEPNGNHSVYTAGEESRDAELATLMDLEGVESQYLLDLLNRSILRRTTSKWSEARKPAMITDAEAQEVVLEILHAVGIPAILGDLNAAVQARIFAPFLVPFETKGGDEGDEDVTDEPADPESYQPIYGAWLGEVADSIAGEIADWLISIDGAELFACYIIPKDWYGNKNVQLADFGNVKRLSEKVLAIRRGLKSRLVEFSGFNLYSEEEYRDMGRLAGKILPKILKKLPEHYNRYPFKPM